jgi:hypothetical protein
MMLRTRKRGRTALIPNQWSGSVQQYYHFLLGYLAPILAWTDKSGADALTVRDCGPMNKWFEVIPKNVDVEVMQVGHFLHVFSGKLQPCVVLKGMDFPEEFSQRDLTRFRLRMLELLEVSAAPANQVSILDRGPGDPFYFSPESEINLSGSERRSVPNLAECIDCIETEIPSEFFDAKSLSVREQVLRMARTRVLVGQHGAGLANMVFMNPGGIIIEIQPPLPGEVIELFKRLARACGHKYVVVSQESVHGPVDCAELANAVGKAWGLK